MSDLNITALLPIRDGARFVKSIRESIEKNLDKNDEIIVINDGSTDLTGKLINEWRSENSQVKLIDTEGVGIVKALNLGLSQSNNKWIARFDADDTYAPNRVKLQRELINNENVAVFCDYSLYTDAKKKIGTLPSAIYSQAVSVSLMSSQRTPHPGVLYNGEAVKEVGSYRDSDFPAEDLSLWLRLSRIGKLVGVPQDLLRYKLSSKSISGTQREFAVQKKHQLLQEISINKSDFDWCIENWEELFQKYDKFELPYERKLLFIYDLFKSAKHLDLRVNQANKVLLNGILKSDYYLALSNIAKTKFLKKLNRIGFFP